MNLKLTILPILLFPAVSTFGQIFSANNLLSIASLTPTKFESYLSKKGFDYKFSEKENDTIVKVYEFKKKKNAWNLLPDSIIRFLSRTDMKNDFYFEYY